MDCRFCGADVNLKFRSKILEKYDVGFYKCVSCESLQTEEPYWLNEAYTDAISSLDVGAVYRNLNTHAAIMIISRLSGLNGLFLDFGGGTGMLCRLMRDFGADAYSVDKYSAPVYSRGFSTQPEATLSGKVSLVSAVEVFEHFSNPRADLEEIFRIAPDVIFATTELYSGEGPEWRYLSLKTGQHIFFYTEKSMQNLAAQAGYYYCGKGSFQIFFKKRPGFIFQSILTLMLKPLGLRFARMLIALTYRSKHIEEDHANLLSLSRSDDLAV